MKKLILGICLSAVALTGFSQGTVNFNNAVYVTAGTVGPASSSNGKTDRLVYWTDNSTKLTGTNWVAQLFYATAANVTDENTLVAVDAATKKFRDPATANGFEGTWSGGNKTLAGVTNGMTATLQVRVWDGSQFTTWGGPLGATTGNLPTGKSALFNYTVPASGAPTTAFQIDGLQSFTLQVPEPSTIALGVLGAASLLFVRRRK
jgi:hypothetical protein